MAAIKSVSQLSVPSSDSFSPATCDALRLALLDAIANPQIRAVALVWARSPGAASDPASEDRQLPKILALQHIIECAPKPIIAALSGSIEGDGFKLALACHYRIIRDDSVCALSDVERGLVPDAGSTQRLTRLAGVDAALSILLTGQPVTAAAGLETGLFDRVLTGESFKEEVIRFAHAMSEAPTRHVLARERIDKLSGDRDRQDSFDEARAMIGRRYRGFLAPDFCIRCIEAAADLDFEQGLRTERRLAKELVSSPESAAQRYRLEAEKLVWKIPEIDEHIPPYEIGSIGVIGCGTMGVGIAMAFADAGLPVTLIGTRPESIERALASIRSEYQRLVRRSSLSSTEAAERVALICTDIELEAARRADLIVEAAVERIDVKREIFARLDRIAKPETILATNTSYLDIDEIARVTDRPGHVLGLHFFTPAHLMKLLEVIRSQTTSRRVVATAMALARRLGKIAVLSRVCHGFIGNRLMNARQLGADSLLLEGAMPWEVDSALYEFGFPLGAFAVWDLAGLDVGWIKEKSRGQTIKDILCERGRFGRKAGAGYHDYDERFNASPSPFTERIVQDFARRSGVAARSNTGEEIIERCLYPMINEGAKLLDEKIAIRASDIDMVWQHGYKWPAYLGGPMYWADRIGIERIVDRLSALHSRLGRHFEPAPLMIRMARDGVGFNEITA